MNYYALDPNDGPFAWKKEIDPEPPGRNNCGKWPSPDSYPARPDLDEIVYVCPDYISNISKTFSLMRYSYYDGKIGDMDKFDGFVPRAYVPATNLASVDEPDFTVTQTLSIIDTNKEIKVGVGYDWDPLELDVNEIQVPTQLAQYLNVTVGDDLILYIQNVFNGDSTLFDLASIDSVLGAVA